MTPDERIKLFQKDIDELDQHAELSDVAYHSTLQAMKDVNAIVKNKEKTTTEFQIMSKMLKEKLSQEIEFFRISNTIIKKFSNNVAKEIEVEILDLEQRYQNYLRVHEEYAKDLNVDKGSEVLKIARPCSLQALIVFRMIKYCRMSIIDTVSKIKELQEPENS